MAFALLEWLVPARSTASIPPAVFRSIMTRLKRQRSEMLKNRFYRNAEAFTKSAYSQADRLAVAGTLPSLRYLNSEEYLSVNAGWYMFVNQIGAVSDYAGADLVSNWYARNLHMFANIRRSIHLTPARIVVFVGAGHVTLLRSMASLDSDMQLVDPLIYLK